MNSSGIKLDSLNIEDLDLDKLKIRCLIVKYIRKDKINYVKKELQPPKINNDISDLIYWYDVEEYGHEPMAREIAEKAFQTRVANIL